MGRSARDMTVFERYGIYYLPEPGDFADFGAAWLGWDVAAGEETAPLTIDGLPRPRAELTATPARYGFHATFKPPFRLAEGEDPDRLDAAMAGFCRQAAPAMAAGLRLATLSGHVALVPSGDVAALDALAAETVRALDAFRAPPSDEELARRRAAALSPRQEANLLAWGYPYVMDDFRFHITLTERLPHPEGRAVIAALAPLLEPLCPAPLRIDALCLVGEDARGRFHLIHRYALSA